MSNYRIYQYTSIARPLEWKATSNRVVLMLLPLALLAGLVKAGLAGGEWQDYLEQGARFILAVFGTWALARELNPDDHVSPFFSLLLGAAIAWFSVNPDLLLMFSTLVLMRIVNRIVGLTSRWTDSIAGLLLAFWVMYALDSPLFALVAALAFALDGHLHEPARRQWLFALVCLGGFVVYLIDHEQGLSLPPAPSGLHQWVSLFFLVLFALNLLLLNQVRSVSDFGQAPLDLNRVRGGMLIGLLAALQGIGVEMTAALPVASIVGVSLGMAIRKGFTTPSGN